MKKNDSGKVNTDNNSLNSSISQSEVVIHRNFWECYYEIRVSEKVEDNEKSSRGTLYIAGNKRK